MPFLLRSHPILNDGTRVTRPHWRRLLALKIDIKDRLMSTGEISPWSDPAVINELIRKKYQETYHD